MKLIAHNVMVKRIMQIPLLALIALILSVSSIFIKMGTDATEKETIGIISRWGFPIHYKITAPGLAWAYSDAIRFCLNCFAWLAVLVTVWVVAFKKKGSAK